MGRICTGCKNARFSHVCSSVRSLEFLNKKLGFTTADSGATEWSAHAVDDKSFPHLSRTC